MKSVPHPGLFPRWLIRALGHIGPDDFLRRAVINDLLPAEEWSARRSALAEIELHRNPGWRTVLAVWWLGYCELDAPTNARVVQQLFEVVRAPFGLAEQMPVGSWGLVVIAVLCLPCVGVPALVGLGISHTRSVLQATLRAAAAHALGCLGARQCIGQLARGMRSGNADVREECHGALHRLLPLITWEQFGTLTPQELADVTFLLNDRDAGMVAKVLHALECVGTPLIAGAVQTFAIETQSGPLRAQAERVLAALELRRKQAEDYGRLARPAAAPGSDVRLLRPAGSASTDPGEQLLRPSQSEQQP